MLRWLADENFNGDIARGLFFRQSDFDLVRVQDIGPDGAADPEILEWAARNQRIVLTHDRATMADFANSRVANRLPMAGIVVVNDRASVRQIIDDLLLIDECSELTEWAGVVAYLPLA